MEKQLQVWALIGMTPCAYDLSCLWDVKYKQAHTNDNIIHHLKHGTSWHGTDKLEASMKLHDLC